MTRIVAGAARGRRLVVPAGRAVRPTSDRVREALFSALEADLRGLVGRAFLDLYAGSGAVGLEAASRGADPVWLVESDRRAGAAIRANIAAVSAAPSGTAGVAGTAGPAGRLAPISAERFCASPPAGVRFEVVFADPPYALPGAALADRFAELLRAGALAPDATVVAEQPTRAGPFPWPGGLVADRSRRYGDTTLWYGRATGGPGGDAPGRVGREES